MENEIRLEEQKKKYSFLKKSEYFLRIDDDEEYDKRIIYYYQQTMDDVVYEASIYIPIVDGENYDWEFFKYKKIEDMAVRTNSYRSLPETEEWFHQLAKPIDNLVRLRKLTQ